MIFEDLLVELDIDVQDFVDIFESEVYEMFETGSATIASKSGNVILKFTIEKEQT